MKRFLITSLFFLFCFYLFSNERNVAIIESKTLTDGQLLENSEYPFHLKKGITISFECNLKKFDKIAIGKGYQKTLGRYVLIDQSGISCVSYNLRKEPTTKRIAEHGLKMEKFLKVIMRMDNDGKCDLIVQTLNGYFQTEFDWTFEAQYEAFVRSEGTEATDIRATFGNKDFNCDVWAFGDSYFGVNKVRWPGWIREMGYFNFLLNGLSGQNCPNAYKDLLRCLEFGTPKYLLWCLGMNGSNEAYRETLDKLIVLCKEKGIELILSTIPTIPERDKEVINNWVKGSGYRYIDFAKAVGATPKGEWYDGYLEDKEKGVHPLTIGAQALATQVLVEFPELIQY